MRECIRALAAADLLGVGWPKEFGGRGFSAIEQFIFAEEAQTGQRADPAGDAQHRRADPDAVRHRGAKAEVPAGDPATAASSSRSATPSRRRAAIWPRCAPPRSATATST